MKQTSIDAYHAPETQIKQLTQKERVKEVFDNYPKDDLTAHDIADYSGLGYYTVQRRINLVVNEGYAKITGKSKVGSYSATTYKKA